RLFPTAHLSLPSPRPFSAAPHLRAAPAALRRTPPPRHLAAALRFRVATAALRLSPPLLVAPGVTSNEDGVDEEGDAADKCASGRLARAAVSKLPRGWARAGAAVSGSSISSSPAAAPRPSLLKVRRKVRLAALNNAADISLCPRRPALPAPEVFVQTRTLLRRISF
ncbi:unnamed protein product, partial [Urochloa humidicola]